MSYGFEVRSTLMDSNLRSFVGFELVGFEHYGFETNGFELVGFDSDGFEPSDVHLP